MTSAELRRKAADSTEKASLVHAAAEKENRELTEDESALFDSYMAEAETYTRRADQADKVERAMTEVRKANPRVGEPIEFKEFQSHESEGEKRHSFSDWLSNVDKVSDPRTSHLEREEARNLLDNLYKSEYRKWDDPKRPKEVRNLAMNSGTTGGYLMPTGFYNKLLEVMSASALVRPNALVIPMATETIKVPSLDQTTAQTAGNPPYFGGVVLSWSGESVSITSTDPAFRQTELTLHELTGYTGVGRTLLQRSAISLEPLIYRLFGQAAAWTEDYAFFNGNGIGKPLGVLNAPCRIKTSARGSASAVTYANFTDVWIRVLTQSRGSGAWFVSQAMEGQFLKATASSNSVFAPTGVYLQNSNTINVGPAGVSLFMRPVMITDKLPGVDTDGDVNFFDFSQYLIADGGPPEIASSDDYLFRTNERAFRIVHRVGGAPWLNNYITLADASTTVSPFVSLGIQ